MSIRVIAYLIVTTGQLIGLFGCCYAVAGVQFLFFRYALPETEERFRRFLPRYHRHIADEVTAQRQAGARIRLHLSVFRRNAPFLLPSSCLLLVNHAWFSFIPAFLGTLIVGHEIGCSWYGSRCMQKLGISAFALQQ